MSADVIATLTSANREFAQIYLRPRDADVHTNLLVRTQAHSYIFELKVVAADWTTLEQVRRAGVQYRIGFRYPADAAFAKDEAAPGTEARCRKKRA